MSLNDHEKSLSWMFDRALKLRDEGRLSDAAAGLSELVEQLEPQDAKLLLHANLQLGYIHSRMRDQVREEEFFRRAAQIAPRSELASLGLFHAMIRRGAWGEALQEAVRLLRLRGSAEYEQWLAGIDPEDFSEAVPLLDEMRRLLVVQKLK